MPLELKGFTDWLPLVSLASKGAVLEGPQLASISTSLGAAASLVKKMRSLDDAQGSGGSGGSGGGGGGGGGAVPHRLPALFDGVGVQAALKLAIDEAVDDAGA